MLPWAQMMRAALSAGVPVSAFWALSVREWRWLSEVGMGDAMTPVNLESLMENFPDRDE